MEDKPLDNFCANLLFIIFGVVIVDWDDWEGGM